MGESIAAHADKVLEDMGGNVFLMLRADITDKIFFTLKFVNNSCEWLKEQGSVGFDLPTMQKFVKGKLSLDTVFFGTSQISFDPPQTVTATPSQTPSQTSQTPSAPKTKDSGEMILFEEDSNFVGNIEIQALLQDILFDNEIIS